MLSKPRSDAHRTLLFRDKSYAQYICQGHDGMSSCGLSYSEIEEAVSDAVFGMFQRANKGKRSRMLLSGAVSIVHCLVLAYRNYWLKRSTSIMDKIKIDYLLKKRISPLLKWPGGKSSDLKYLIEKSPYLFPKKIRHFYEPFVGGGATWLSLTAEKMFINDLCEELIEFYRLVSNHDQDFFDAINGMAKNWDELATIAKENCDDIYKLDSLSGVKTLLSKYENSLKENSFAKEYADGYFDILCKIVASKLTNIRRAESKKNTKLPEEDVLPNIEGALKAGMYTYVRDILNKEKTLTPLKVACFYFMRDYCFSSMFRYNSEGEFNVPYGGLSYNSRSPAAKVKHWQSEEVFGHLSNTQLYNMDFEAFLRKMGPSKEDFIFVDPPYDSEFSTYANNAFTHKDQERLANYLCSDTDAQFMAVMKNTDRIYELYNRSNVKCQFFDKSYSVSFMNRNSKDVQHLVAYRLNE